MASEPRFFKRIALFSRKIGGFHVPGAKKQEFREFKKLN